ncbi:MAG: hypothetical protein K1060chlam1_00781 [Candidatus Anoxychlamydiales bacterium]|nr:hypothetical protein [Candidatus Anoxychlamydiales bacterium]
MKILIYFIEWTIAFFIIWGLNFSLNNLLRKKLSPIMSSIFTFVIIGLFCFLISPYLITFTYPSLIYLPIAFFFFVLTIVKVTKV